MSSASVGRGAEPATFVPQPDGGYSRPVLVEGHHRIKDITTLVAGVIEKPTPRWWLPALSVSAFVMSILVTMIVYLISTGVGVWGVNQPVSWGFAIVNFVFWIGIGHAGTLISAILFIFRQKWRTSINRAAEAMTLFAVICAGIFPGVHVGRFWAVWFMAPLPNANAIWPNFRSALLWDVFAVSTYFTVSVIFWYVGLIPDLATMRDRSTGWARKLYGFFALGWRGSGKLWKNYEAAYVLLACLSTPLVLSVHTVVSFDFATSVIPGWHTTIFPPYFVAGAIFGGFAMVCTLLVPTRSLFPELKDLITVNHLENMAKIMLATGMMVGYAYAMEAFIAWYGANSYERYTFYNRSFGPYWWAYWIMWACNVISPQFFWFKRFRRNPWFIWWITIFINIGMWFERFVIVLTLHRDFLPSSWGEYWPTWVDGLSLFGSFGLFFFLYLLFIKYVPVIAIAEVKSIMPEADPHHHGHGHGHGYESHADPGHDSSKPRREGHA